MITVQPGDVLVVHDASIWARLIRLGGWRALGGPNHWNHVLIVKGHDKAGTLWGIEGRPGGVGDRDITAAGYLTSKWTLTNAAQPKTDAQRAQIVAAAQAMAKSDIPYDWTAIATDAIREVDPLWRMRDQWGPGAPAHVVCSSAADYVYQRVGLANPAADRWCTPWDWARFCRDQQWR